MMFQVHPNQYDRVFHVWLFYLLSSFSHAGGDGFVGSLSVDGHFSFRFFQCVFRQGNQTDLLALRKGNSRQPENVPALRKRIAVRQ